MKNIQNSSIEYLKQYFILKKIPNSSEDFKEKSYEIVQKLSENYSCNVTIYDTQGEFINQSILFMQWIWYSRN